MWLDCCNVFAYSHISRKAVFNSNSTWVLLIFLFDTLIHDLVYQFTQAVKADGAYSVGNKAIERIPRRKQNAPNFPKNKHFSPPDTHTRVRMRGKEILVFRKIWRALFSCNTRFRIRPFALLPTISSSNTELSFQPCLEIPGF